MLDPARPSGLALPDQVDLADAAGDIETQVNVGLAVGIVDVGAAFLVEALHVDAAQPSGGRGPDAHVARQLHGGLAHSAANLRLEVVVPGAGKVHMQLARADLDLQPAQRRAGKLESALAGSHVDPQLDRYLVVQVQVPAVLPVARVEAMDGGLADGEVAAAGADVVL